MAYYRNYTSKEDILNKFVDDVGTKIHKKLIAMGSDARVQDYYLSLLEELSSYNDLAITAYEAGLGELILGQISKQMASTFPTEDDSPADHYRHLYMAGAFYNVFIEWLKSGQKESCFEIARLCATLTMEGCHPHFTKGSNQK